MAAKIGVEVAKALWPAARRLRDNVDAHREFAQMIERALEVTLCPSGSSDQSLGSAVEVLGDRLGAVGIPKRPGRKMPGRLKRLFSPGLPVAAYGRHDFAEVLSEWLARAIADNTDARAALGWVNCPDTVERSPENLTARFPQAFFRVLYTEFGERRYGERLLESLRKADEKRSWARDQLAIADRVLAGTAGGTLAGGITAGVAELVGASDKTTAIVAGANAITSAALNAAASGWGADRSRPKIDDHVRSAVRTMLVEWAHFYAHETAQSDALRAAEALGELWRYDPPTDAGDLARRVAYQRDAAYRARDEELATALFELGDALLASRGEGAANKLREALAQTGRASLEPHH